MVFYTWFHGKGRAVLAYDLGTDDPFGLEPGDIVDRVVAAGYLPAIDAPQNEPFQVVGKIAQVERESVIYFVSLSRDSEEIRVQERRAEAYDPVE